MYASLQPDLNSASFEHPKCKTENNAFLVGCQTLFERIGPVPWSLLPPDFRVLGFDHAFLTPSTAQVWPNIPRPDVFHCVHGFPMCGFHCYFQQNLFLGANKDLCRSLMAHPCSFPRLTVTRWCVDVYLMKCKPAQEIKKFSPVSHNNHLRAIVAV